MTLLFPKNNTIYISIGSDCAIAYQLRELGLVNTAFPFDWIKTNNIEMICDTLENNFENFFCNYTLKEQSNNFEKFSESSNEKIKSRIKIILKNKIQMPHEASENYFNFEEFKKKYTRRIKRFNQIVKSNEYKKIFIRADNKTISESDKKKLYDSLIKYGVVNFEIKYISYDAYTIDSNFTWQRTYMRWKELINL